MTWHNCQFVLGADLPARRWEKNLQRRELGRHTLCKLPHHASKDAVSSVLLNGTQDRRWFTTPWNRKTGLPRFEDGQGMERWLRACDEVWLTALPMIFPIRPNGWSGELSCPERHPYSPEPGCHTPCSRRHRLVGAGCFIVSTRTGDWSGRKPANSRGVSLRTCNATCPGPNHWLPGQRRARRRSRCRHQPRLNRASFGSGLRAWLHRATQSLISRGVACPAGCSGIGCEPEVRTEERQAMTSTSSVLRLRNSSGSSDLMTQLDPRRSEQVAFIPTNIAIAESVKNQVIIRHRLQDGIHGLETVAGCEELHLRRGTGLPKPTKDLFQDRGANADLPYSSITTTPPFPTSASKEAK